MSRPHSNSESDSINDLVLRYLEQPDDRNVDRGADGRCARSNRNDRSQDPQASRLKSQHIPISPTRTFGIADGTDCSNDRLRGAPAESIASLAEGLIGPTVEDKSAQAVLFNEGGNIVRSGRATFTKSELVAER